MSADSRIMNFWQSARVWARMYDSAVARYQITDMSDEEYVAECSHVTDCMIVRAVARIKMLRGGYLKQNGEE